MDLEKLQKEREEKDKKAADKAAKKERKERRREKKEKKEKRRREKEEKLKDSTTSHASVGGIKFKLNNEVKEHKDSAKLRKVEDYENEQLERSGITEELEQPVCSPQEPYSSDSSQSSKRKRGTEFPSQDHGPAIRIRLPLRKHREPEESKQVCQLGSCSRSVRVADSLPRDTSRIDRPLLSIKKAETPSRSVGVADLPARDTSRIERLLPSIKKAETPSQHHGKSAPKVCKPLPNVVPVDAVAAANETVDDESRRMDSLYKSLLHIQPITYELGPLDQDWLFSSVPKETMPISKKQKTDAFQCSKSLLQPRAQYMPEADIYALPYTVPF